MAQRQIFEPDGRAVPYIDDGEGPSLVLIPDRGLDIAYLEVLARILTDQGFHVVRIGARRVSGESASAPTMHDLAQDVIDVMDEIDLAHSWIGGHGFGGAVARTVALDHTDRTNGILLLSVDGASPSTDAAARALRTVSSDAGDDEILGALPHLTGGAADVAHVWSVYGPARVPELTPAQDAALAATPEAEWAALAPAMPVLIMHGTDDEVSPLSNAEQLQASAPDRASIVRIEGGGHLFPLTHPGETAADIEEYLDWD